MSLKTSLPAMDQYSCSRCNQTMQADEKTEHDDWHFAQDLQSQEQGSGATASQPPPKVAPPTYPPDVKHPYQPDPAPTNGGSSGQTPQYAPPSHPPPTNGASRAAARHHTNQLIEVSHIRAKDEVLHANIRQVKAYNRTDFFIATNAEHAAKCAVGKQYIQHRHRARTRDRLLLQLLYPSISEDEMESIRRAGCVVKGGHVSRSVHRIDPTCCSYDIHSYIEQERKHTMTTTELALAYSAATPINSVSSRPMATIKVPGVRKDRSRPTMQSQYIKPSISTTN